MQPTNALITYDVALEIQRVKAAREMVIQLRKDVLVKGVDYGPQPGAGKIKDLRTGEEKEKDVLKKPGAEKLCSLFHYRPEFEAVSEVERWDEDQPLFHYRYQCKLIHIETGLTVATGIGSCNTRESKYRWRNAERICPTCGKANIRHSKEDGKGWYCWKKTEGCGATFAEDDPAITSQTVGKVANPDIYDLVNTADKMAQKRALIAATLIGCSASEFFTQDLDDMMAQEEHESGTIVDGEIVENTPPASQTKQPPAKTEQKSNGKPADEKPADGKKQSWNQIDTDWKKFKNWLRKEYEMTPDEAATKVGKSWDQFDSGKAACLAVQEAMKKPAKPKEDNRHWFDTDKGLGDLAELANEFELTTIEVAKNMGLKSVQDFHNYPTLTAAQEAVRAKAFEGLWHMTAKHATYKEVGDKKLIVLDSPIPCNWWKGRHELVEAMKHEGAADMDWSAVEQWEVGNTYDLPEPVRIYPEKDGDKLVAGRVEAASTMPLPF